MSLQPNVSANLMQRSIRIALRAFVRQQDWSLKFDSNQPYMSFSTKTVHLPPINDQVTPDMNTLMWGFLHHEMGHVNHTDSRVILQCQNGILKKLWNAIEDARMEHNVVLQYPGVDRRLKDLVATLGTTSFFSEPETACPIRMLQAWVLYTLRSKYLGQTALWDYANQAEAGLFDMVGERAFIRLKSNLMAITLPEATTQDSLNIAQNLLDILKKEIEDDDDESDVVSANNAEQPRSGEQINEPENDDQGPADGTQSQPDSNDGPSKASTGSLSEPSDYQKEAIRQILDADDTDLDPNLGDLGEALAPQVEAHASMPCNRSITSEYIIDSSSDQRNPALYDEAMASIFGLAARLKSLLYVPTRRTKRNRFKGSRLDSRSLYKAAAGNRRIFCKTTVTSSVELDLVVLLDASSSMSSKDMAIAKKAALAANAVLASIKGVSVASAAFYGERNVLPMSHFGQDVRSISGNFDICSRGYTPMTQAINWALEQLSVSNSPRKQILVITDGCPSDSASTIKAVELAKSAGVEVMGIGIGSDYIGSIIPTSKIIFSSEELQNAILDIFRETRLAI